ncbi:MAG: hypothetical protein ABDH23_02950 [Endomicrobiia bacterium]
MKKILISTIIILLIQLYLHSQEDLSVQQELTISQELNSEIAIEFIQDGYLNESINELKQADYQLGKSLRDAYGYRVRVEEYILKPQQNQVKFLVLNKREAEEPWRKLNYYYDLLTFEKPIENILDVPKIRNHTWFHLGENPPQNRLVKREWELSNTVDYYRVENEIGELQKHTYTANYNYILDQPQQTTYTWWMPESFTHREKIWGPDYQKIKEYVNVSITDINSTDGIINWNTENPEIALDIRFPGAELKGNATYGFDETALTKVTTPDSPVIPKDGYYDTEQGKFVKFGELFVSKFVETKNLGLAITHTLSKIMPDGFDKIHLRGGKIYADETWKEGHFRLINNEGEVYTFGELIDKIVTTKSQQNQQQLEVKSDAATDLAISKDELNFEITFTASEFNGRAIDVVIAPEIIKQVTYGQSLGLNYLNGGKEKFLGATLASVKFLK